MSIFVLKPGPDITFDAMADSEYFQDPDIYVNSIAIKEALGQTKPSRPGLLRNRTALSFPQRNSTHPI